MKAVNKTHDVSAQLQDRVELLPGKLDFALLPTRSFGECTTTFECDEEQFVCIDDHLVYARFFADFGPLQLSRTVRFCRELESRMDFSTSKTHNRLVLYCSDHPHKRANAMTLLSIFLVVVAEFTPEAAVTRVLNNGKFQPPFGFRDASTGICTYFITILDCARAVQKAISTSLWSYNTFSPDEYDHLDAIDNGDINWIVPGKLLAFSGPQRERVVLDAKSGATTLLARDYAARFRAMGVSCVIRFNETITYDRKAFTHVGLRHIDMEFPDGSNPSDEILFKFIRICERENEAVAVHCKAGLGRTGTAIAAYIMKNYRFSASEAIAWCRICRPGSIVGPQQHFLAVKQPQLHALPSIFESQSPNQKKIDKIQLLPLAQLKTHQNSR